MHHCATVKFVKYSVLKTAAEVGEGFEVKCAGDLMGKDRCRITLQDANCPHATHMIEDGRR